MSVQVQLMSTKGSSDSVMFAASNPEKSSSSDSSSTSGMILGSCYIWSSELLRAVNMPVTLNDLAITPVAATASVASCIQLTMSWRVGPFTSA